MSDYKRGKINAEVWADRTARMIEAAGATNNPLASVVEYKTRVSTNIFSSTIPSGVLFSDPILIKTHRIIMGELPAEQRQELFAFLFRVEKRRETNSIKATYKRIGRALNK